MGSLIHIGVCIDWSCIRIFALNSCYAAPRIGRPRLGFCRKRVRWGAIQSDSGRDGWGSFLAVCASPWARCSFLENLQREERAASQQDAPARHADGAGLLVRRALFCASRHAAQPRVWRRVLRGFGRRWEPHRWCAWDVGHRRNDGCSCSCWIGGGGAQPQLNARPAQSRVADWPELAAAPSQDWGRTATTVVFGGSERGRRGL